MSVPVAEHYPDELVAAITAEVLAALGPLDPEPVVAASTARRVDEHSSRRLTAIDRDLRTKLVVACNATLKRTLEKAGAKIISKSRVASAAPIRSRIKDVEAWRVPSVIGPLTIQAALGLTAADLLDTAFPDLRRQWDDWVASAQDAALRVAAKLGAVPLSTVYAKAGARMTADRQAGWDQLQASLDTRAGELMDGLDEDSAPLNGDTLAPPQYIRAAMAVAGGYLSAEGVSRNIIDARPEDPADPFAGIGTGDTIVSVLTDLGAEIAQYQWLHGMSDRPLDGHLELDGTEFAAWDDDALLNDSDFPQDDYYYPGDHAGCLCDNIVLWVPAGGSEGEPETSEGESDAGGPGGEADIAAAGALVAGFNPDQPRDDDGRFASTGDSEESGGGRRVESMPGSIAPGDPNKDVAFKDRLGRCYELSAQYATNNPGSTLVHGTIQGAGQDPIYHAWVETRDGKVFEPATGHLMGITEFHDAFNPHADVAYSAAQAGHEMLDSGHYGPWAAEASGGGPTGNFEQDSARVGSLAGSYLDAGRDTQGIYDLIDGKEGKYSDDREQLHQEIINHFVRASGVESDRQLLTMAGLPGAGNTTFLTSAEGQQTVGVDLSKYVTVNADDIKAELFARGAVPSYPGLTPEESTGLVHEESSYLAKQVLASAVANGQNVAYDVTLSRSSQFTQAVELAKSAGHDYQTTAILVNTPVATAVDRAVTRYENGGRFVPTDFINSMATASGDTKPVLAFNEIKSQVDKWVVVDNQSGTPLVTTGNNAKQTVAASGSTAAFLAGIDSETLAVVR